MSRRNLLVAFVIASWVIPATASARDACVPAGAQVDRDNGRSVVYVARDTAKVYACLRSRPRQVALASNDPYTEWTARLAGRYVAVGVNSCSGQGCSPSRVNVFDLSTGRRVTRSVFRESSFPLQRLDALELRATGTAIFTGSSKSFGTAWVWRLRRGQRRRLLDHGEQVDALSLSRTSPTTVSWAHGTETRTASL